MFYKIIDENTLEKFVNPLKVDGKHIFTNSEEVLNSNGYYKVIMTPYPEEEEENTYFVSKYAVMDNMIYRIWEKQTIETEEVL